jgi:hypothetical protein
MPERRGAPRTNVQWAARLSFAGKSVECTLRNISDTGAAVSVAGAKKIPDRVILIIAGKPGQKQAEVVWRTADSLGLRFVSF